MSVTDLTRRIKIFDNLTALSEAAASDLVNSIQARLRTAREFHLALAGGRTPAQLYQRLAAAPYREYIDWNALFWYFGDERFVPQDHPESNFRMARETLFTQVPIPTAQIYPMVSEATQPQQEAQRYSRLLDTRLPKQNGVPCFDMVLLGMGADGHTASLFPGTAILQEQHAPVATVYVEKLSAWRVSLTLPALNAARQVMILVSGADKAAALARVFGELSAQLPIQQLQVRDTVTWYVDSQAAALLSD